MILGDFMEYERAQQRNKKYILYDETSSRFFAADLLLA